jgi:hypothetical protein
MFLGHYGVAYALKRWEPRLSLGTLFLSVGLVDTAWSIFIITGWERARIVPGLTPANPIEFLSYPLTHSLLAGLLWGAIAGAVTYTWPTRDTSRHHWIKAAVVALAVLSHWFLDLIVHLPDLPLTSDSSPKFGLGLWKNLPLTITLEFVIFLGGLVLYLQMRSKANGEETWKALVVAAVLAIFYLAATFSPPPPSMRAVGIMGLIGTLLIAAMGWWSDRRVKPIPQESASHTSRRSSKQSSNPKTRKS